METDSSKCSGRFGIAASVMLVALIGFLASINIDTQVLFDSLVGTLNSILILLLGR